MFYYTLQNHNSALYIIFLPCIWSNGSQVSRFNNKVFQLGIKLFLHCFLFNEFISDAFSTVLSLWMSQKYWSVCSLTSTRSTVYDHSKKLKHSSAFLWFLPPFPLANKIFIILNWYSSIVSLLVLMPAHKNHIIDHSFVVQSIVYICCLFSAASMTFDINWNCLHFLTFLHIKVGNLFQYLSKYCLYIKWQSISYNMKQNCNLLIKLSNNL